MLRIVLVVIVLLIAGVLVYAATRPDSFRVQRSANIKAPPDRIFALIDDLERWRAWSPYEAKDPAMKRTLGSVSRGKGAVYEWDGNRNVGQGRMEILESMPPAKITIKLDFLKPFEAHNTAEFTLEPQGEGTRVTWAIFGPMPYMSKLMGVFMDMDRMIGKDFEVGLATLKTAAEK
jgi:carbon monoxide dehydrogenase subunit G